LDELVQLNQLGPTGRRILSWSGLLLILAMSVTGFIGVREQLKDADTTGRLVQTIAQVAYGVLGLLSVVTTFWSRRLNLLVLGGFAVACAIAWGLAPVVWGGQGLEEGVVRRVSGLLVAAAEGWMVRVGCSENRTESTH